MTVFDVFNGDADGICALTQLRNAQPLDSTLVTGVKRDIELLSQVSARSGDHVNVLDISMDKNHRELLRLLDAGASVFYCDHHFAGDIPESSQLDVLVNTAADICTSLLINQRLSGAFVEWAIVGAFGDNLNKSAQVLAKKILLNTAQVSELENLGIYINYNGYGASLEDLHFAPAELFRLVNRYASPRDFIAGDRASFQKLEGGYREDMSAAQNADVLLDSKQAAAFLLPNAAWARRVSGVYSNDLANAHPDRAHAVLTEQVGGTYLVSVRAPLNNKTGADELCMEFPTGGGRKAAAGINALPANELDRFLERLKLRYS